MHLEFSVYAYLAWPLVHLHSYITHGVSVHCGCDCILLFALSSRICAQTVTGQADFERVSIVQAVPESKKSVIF